MLQVNKIHSVKKNANQIYIGPWFARLRVRNSKF